VIMKITPKIEAFCQAIVSGSSQSDAYRKAYNAERMKAETIHNKAYALMKKGEIRARIEEIRKPVIEKVRYGLEDAMKEAEEAMQICRRKEQGGAMVAAVQLRSKLNGLIVEKRENRNGPLEELPDSSLDNIINRKAKELGLTLH